MDLQIPSITPAWWRSRSSSHSTTRSRLARCGISRSRAFSTAWQYPSEWAKADFAEKRSASSNTSKIAFPSAIFLHSPIVIKQSRDSSNHIFANRFEQKMDGLTDATFVHRSNRHRKSPWVLNHQHGTPVLLGPLFEAHLSGVECFSHWNEPFLPDLIVKDEITEARMFLNSRPNRSSASRSYQSAAFTGALMLGTVRIFRGRRRVQ